MISSFILNSGLCLIPFCPLIGQPPPLSLETDVGLGYRVDSANWNIAGPYNHPNVLSELIWKDLEMAEMHLGARLEGIARLYGRAYFEYGWILSGKNQDSDYHGDDRTLEYSRSTANAGKGHVFDVSVAGGVPIISFPFLTAAVVGGYSFHEQHLWLYDGVIDICTQNPDVVGNKISGLNSDYINSWSTPFVGTDVSISLCGITLIGEWEYHFDSFSGRGHWNLRQDYIDYFKDRARSASGTRSALKCYMRVFGPFQLGLLGEYCTMKGEGGRSQVDVAKYSVNASGEVERHEVTLETGFNQVNWHSFRITALLSCFF